MNEWNIDQKHLEKSGAAPPPRARRVSFCPTCGRPFLRGKGARRPGKSPQGANLGAVEEEPEYCGAACLPTDGSPAG